MHPSDGDVVDAWRGGPPSSEPLDDRIRQGYRRQRWRIVPGVVVTIAIVQVGEAILRHDRHGRVHHRPQPLWLFVLALVLFLGLYVIAAVAVVQRRRAGAASPARSPLWALTRAERRLVGRQVRGRAPVRSEQELPLLRLLAERQTRQVAAIVLLLDLAAASACLAVVQRHTPVAWLLLAVGAYMLGTSGYLLWVARRARTFLRQHPESDTDQRRVVPASGGGPAEPAG